MNEEQKRLFMTRIFSWKPIIFRGSHNRFQIIFTDIM